MSETQTALAKATEKEKMAFEVWADRYHWEYDEGTNIWWKDGYNDKTSDQLYALYLKLKSHDH